MLKNYLVTAGLLLSTIGHAALAPLDVAPIDSVKPKEAQLVAPTATPAILPVKPVHQLEVRAAIDIGSGSTKLKVAEVDVKTNKVVKVLLKKEIAIGFEKQLSHSDDMRFNQQIIDQAVQTFAELKDEAIKYHAKKVVGIATASFRKAKNANELIETIKQKTGVEIYVIDQDHEGRIAFQGAIATCRSACNENAVTWDIGGGSVQYTIEDKTQNLLVYKETLASVPFHNYIVTAVQGKILAPENSPNPMSTSDISTALTYAKEFTTLITPEILTKIRANGTIIMGVGGVFAGQVANMFNKKEDEELVITVEKMQAKLNYYKGLDNNGLIAAIKKDVTDPERAKGLSEHINTFFTNIVLILGTMEGLDIKEFFVVDVNNADGAMGTASYWEDKKPGPVFPDLDTTDDEP